MADRVLVDLAGTVLDADAPLLAADDYGVVRGDGVFETLLVRDGQAMQADAHLERLVRSAEMLDLGSVDLAQWRRVIEVALAQWGSEREGALRLVLTRGRESGGPHTGFGALAPMNERTARVREEGIKVITLDRGYSVDFAANAPWMLYGAKTLSYAANMAALRYAKSKDADDVIYVSSDGFVLEGPRSTVIISRGDTLVTPPTTTGILPGTTAGAIFTEAESRGLTTEVAQLTPADLITADGLWLVGSVTVAARVTKLDDLSLPEPEIAARFAEIAFAGVARKGLKLRK